MDDMSIVSKVKFVNYSDSAAKALDLINAGEKLPQDGLIILKPNLTNSSRPPVTTSPEIVEAVYHYCRKYTNAKIIIGEGCGSSQTNDVFRELGYADLAEKLGIELFDFNDAESVLLENKNALQLKKLYVPKIVIDAFVISIPVLKDHCFTGTTVAMKNMFGIAPGKYYNGSWNKSKLHRPSTDKSVVDICTYKKPGLSVVDASVALAGMHLSGTEKKIGLILAGFDCVATDAVASELLGHNRESLEYLVMADGLLGDMKDIEIIKG